jgi:hypothetical protein
LERRCRFLLRAWPWRDRWERGDELVGTMLDVSEGRRSWPSLLLVVDMVLGGIRARLRRRPPLLTRVSYLQGKIPYRWHEWMLDRLLAPGWRRRYVLDRVLVVLWGWLGAWVLLAAIDGGHAIPFLVVGPIVAAVSGSMGAEADRRRVLRRNGYSLEGSPPRLVSLLVWSERPERFPNVRLAPVAAAAAAPLLGGGVLALLGWSTADPPSATIGDRLVLAPVVVALVVSLATWSAAHRVPTGAGDRPTRWTARVSSAAAALAAGCVGLVAAVDVEELTEVLLLLGGGVAGIAAVLLAAVLLNEERRVGRPIGVWDVWPRLAGGPTAVKSAQGAWWWHASQGREGSEHAAPHRTGTDH